MPQFFRQALFVFLLLNLTLQLIDLVVMSEQLGFNALQLFMCLPLF